MFEGLLRLLGFGGARKTVTTVRLDIIAEQVKEFNEAKREINDKINVLEDRTSKLDDTVAETLEMTRDNQSRLRSIEENMDKLIHISEAALTGGAVRPQGVGEPDKDRKPPK